MIFRHHDRFSTAARQRLLNAYHNLIGLSAACEQVDVKYAALFDFAVNFYEALVLFHDSVSCRKPQASAASYFLGCEERLEDVIQNFLRHAEACVGNR